MDYIRAEGDFHREIYIIERTNKAERLSQASNFTGRTESENRELSAEFIE